MHLLALLTILCLFSSGYISHLGVSLLGQVGSVFFNLENIILMLFNGKHIRETLCTYNSKVVQVGLTSKVLQIHELVSYNFLICFQCRYFMV